MKRFHSVFSAVAALALAAGAASACDGAKSADKVSTTSATCVGAKTVGTTASCTAAKTATTAAHCAGMKTAGMTAACCAAKTTGLTASANPMTQIVYRVGETETFDRDEAVAAAETSGAAIQFLAAGTAYDDELAAKGAMTQAIYARLDEMLTVSTTVGGESYACGASAAKAADTSGQAIRYTVAGHEFTSKDAAEGFLAKVRSAVEAVKLTDTEGHAVEGCAVGYCKSHGKTAFKLGDQTIECPVTANYVTAQAKLAAILSADA